MTQARGSRRGGPLGPAESAHRDHCHGPSLSQVSPCQSVGVPCHDSVFTELTVSECQCHSARPGARASPVQDS